MFQYMNCSEQSSNKQNNIQILYSKCKCSTHKHNEGREEQKPALIKNTNAIRIVKLRMSVKIANQTCMLETNAGSIVINSGSMPDKVSPETCQGSGISVPGFTRADSIPFPSISSNNLACISKTSALTSWAFVPSSSLHFILSKLCMKSLKKYSLVHYFLSSMK